MRSLSVLAALATLALAVGGAAASSQASVPAPASAQAPAKAGSWTGLVDGADLLVGQARLASAQAFGASVPAGVPMAVSWRDGAYHLSPARTDVAGETSPDTCFTSNPLGAPVPPLPITATCGEMLSGNVGIPRGYAFNGLLSSFGTGEATTWVNYTNGAQIVFHCTYYGTVGVSILAAAGYISCDAPATSGTFGVVDTWVMAGKITAPITGVVEHVVY